MAKGKKVDEDDDDGEEVTLALSWGVRDKFIWAKNRLGNKFIDCPQAKKGKRKKGNIRIAKRFSTARVVLCLSFLHEHYIISRLTAGRIPKRILMTIGRSQVSLGRIPSTKFALGHLVKAPVRERGPLYRATSFLSFFLSFKRMHSSICRPTGSNLLFFTSGFCSVLFFLQRVLLFWQIIDKGLTSAAQTKGAQVFSVSPCLSSLPLFWYSSSGSLKKRTCHLAYRAKKRERID